MLSLRDVLVDAEPLRLDRCGLSRRTSPSYASDRSTGRPHSHPAFDGFSGAGMSRSISQLIHGNGLNRGESTHSDQDFRTFDELSADIDHKSHCRFALWPAYRRRDRPKLAQPVRVSRLEAAPFLFCAALALPVPDIARSGAAHRLSQPMTTSNRRRCTRAAGILGVVAAARSGGFLRSAQTTISRRHSNLSRGPGTLDGVAPD